MSLSRKHYEEFAQTLGMALTNLENGSIPNDARGMHAYIMERIIADCAADNERFDSNRFRARVTEIAKGASTMITRTIYGHKALFCDAQCADSFREDRKHGLIYGTCQDQDTGEILPNWEASSIYFEFCAYCQASETED